MVASIRGRKIRFALVGCGRISNNHIEALKKFPDDAELVAVCDTAKQALQVAVERTGANGFSDLQTLLANSDADVVSICTPSGLHADQSLKVAAAGRHVLTEKPMATRLEDGIRMTRACEEAGVNLFVVKQNRFNPTLRLLKETIDRRRFGRIYMVNVNVFWTRPQSYYDMAPWRGTRQLDGGAFMNQASHYVDLLTWLVGPLDSVFAATETFERKIEMEDSGAALLRWKSGAIGTMNVTMLTHPKNFEGSITIFGENGTVKVGGVAVNEIQKWDFEDSHPDDEAVRSANYETASVYGHGHPLYYRNVIQVLRGEASAMTDGREGLVSLETLAAIYRSARNQKLVNLPLVGE